MNQGITTVNIPIGCAAVASFRAKSVRIVLVVPGGAVSTHALQLTTAPGIGPGAVVQRVADSVMGDRSAIVSGQQIAPRSVAISVIIGADGFAEVACGIVILCAAGDIAARIIGPHPG